MSEFIAENEDEAVLGKLYGIAFLNLIIVHCFILFLILQ